MIPLNTPVCINTTEVILVDDLVLTHITGNLEDRLMSIDSPDDDLPLYVERRQVDTLSELHPGMPLYGLWQVLIASGRIPKHSGLYQITTDMKPHPARYLIREDDGAYSGWLTHDTMLDVFTPGQASPQPVCLNPDLDTLNLPVQPIQTLQQQHHQQVRSLHRSLALIGFILFSSALGGIATDRILHYRHAQQLQQATSLQEHTTALRQSLQRLNRQGRIEIIDQSERLKQLMILARHAQSVELAPTSLLAAPMLSAIIRDEIEPLPPQGLPIHTQTYQPDASLHVSW